MAAEAFSLLHPGVKEAIYNMGWSALRDLQTRSIRSILQSDKHLLLSAQTAGGKTEAAFLPIISRLAEQPMPSVQALYVGPLKALINDQFQRLETLCSHLHIPVHSWHGDISANRKRKFRENPGGILLITPESLESNFANYGTELHRIYRHLDFVVIDELHAFLDNVRGIHLRSLLSRLELAAGITPRYVGLSATLGDPLEARKFLSLDAPESVEVIQDTSQSRTIRFLIRGLLKASVNQNKESVLLSAAEADSLQNTLVSGESRAFEELLDRILIDPEAASLPEEDELDVIANDIIKHSKNSTNLVFANARSDIESLADRLRQRVETQGWTSDPFYVHHSSVSKELREEAEARAKSGIPTTVICSSTLELGIDIGSVRAVTQVNPPHSVSSALQRLGRSGRREGDDSIMRLYSIDAPPDNSDTSIAELLYPSLLRSIAIARLMFVNKWLEPVALDTMHLSTLVHQTLSCLRQTGGLSATQLFDALIKRGPFRSVSSNDYVQLLRGLADHQIVEQMADGLIILAPSGERITASWDFYAAFTSSDEMTVRHQQTQIGKIESQAVPPIGEHMILAGRRWQIEDIDFTAKQVFVKPAKGRKSLPFQSSSVEIHTRIIQEIKQVLHDSDVPVFIDDAAKQMLLTARNTAERTGLLATNVIQRRGTIEWFPWIGTRGQRVHKIYAKQFGIKYTTTGPLSLVLECSIEKFRDYLESILKENIDLELLENYRFEKFDAFVPDELAKRAYLKDHVAIDEARETAKLELQAFE